MQKALGVTVKNFVAHDLCTPVYLSLTTTTWRATVICKINMSRDAASSGLQGSGLGVGPVPRHNENYFVVKQHINAKNFPAYRNDLSVFVYLSLTHSTY